MADKQKTIKEEFTLSSKGLHTGLDVTMTVKPAPPDHGIKFKRVDMDGQPVIDASVDYVVDTSRGTTLETNGIRIGTIEHVMAGLAGMQIDNVLIETNAPEVPILDGSSKMVVEAINKVGIVEQEALRNYYVVKEIINYTDVEKGIDIKIYPDDHYNLDVLISYPSNVLSNQFASLKNIKDFEKEVSGCKTFVFLHELEFLLKNNLIKGGDLKNALVIIDREVEQEELDRLADLFHKPRVQVKDQGYLNNTDLLFDNEPARHKLLDLIGDLALLGTPIKGKVIASRPGHGANTELAKIIKALIKKEKTKPTAPKYDPNQEPLYDIKKIMKVLPHRPPFLLIDKITELEDNYVVGIKSVTINEGFFIGHFPGEPVMPGVLQVEAMAQTGGILVLNTVPDPENYITYFLKIDKVKFRKSVVPGDTIIFKCDLIAPIRRGVATMYGQAFVGDNVVMEAEMMAQIVKNQ